MHALVVLRAVTWLSCTAVVVCAACLLADVMLRVCLRPGRLVTASVAVSDVGVIGIVEGGSVVFRLSASLLPLKMLLSRAAAAISGTSVDVDSGVLDIAGIGEGVVSSGGVVGDGDGVTARSKSLPLLLSNTAAAASFQVGIGLGSIDVGAAGAGVSGSGVTVVEVDIAGDDGGEALLTAAAENCNGSFLPCRNPNFLSHSL